MHSLQPRRHSVTTLQPSELLYFTARSTNESLKRLAILTGESSINRSVSIDGHGDARISVFRVGDVLSSSIEYNPVAYYPNVPRISRVRNGSYDRLNINYITKVGNYTDPKGVIPIPYSITRLHKLPRVNLQDYNRLYYIIYPGYSGTFKAVYHKQTWLSSNASVCVSWQDDGFVQILDDEPLQLPYSKIWAAMYTKSGDQLRLIVRGQNNVNSLVIYDRLGNRKHWFERDEDGAKIDMGEIPSRILGSGAQFGMFKSSGKGAIILVSRQVGPNARRGPKMELKEFTFFGNDDPSYSNIVNYTLWDFANPFESNNLLYEDDPIDTPIAINEWQDTVSVVLGTRDTTTYTQSDVEATATVTAFTLTYSPDDGFCSIYKEYYTTNLHQNMLGGGILYRFEIQRFPKYTLPLRFKDGQSSLFMIIDEHYSGDIVLRLSGDVYKEVIIPRFHSAGALYPQYSFDGTHVLFSITYNSTPLKKSITYIINPRTLTYDVITPRIDAGIADWDSFFGFQLIPEIFKPA